MLGVSESDPMQTTSKLATRLREISRELMRTDVPYQEWAILESMARRVERRLLAAGVITITAMPLDVEPDASNPSKRPTASPTSLSA
jgi:hypothetical protein